MIFLDYIFCYIPLGFAKSHCIACRWIVSVWPILKCFAIIFAIIDRIFSLRTWIGALSCQMNWFFIETSNAVSWVSTFQARRIRRIRTFNSSAKWHSRRESHSFQLTCFNVSRRGPRIRFIQKYVKKYYWIEGDINALYRTRSDLKNVCSTRSGRYIPSFRFSSKFSHLPPIVTERRISSSCPCVFNTSGTLFAIFLSGASGYCGIYRDCSLCSLGVVARSRFPIKKKKIIKKLGL